MQDLQTKRMLVEDVRDERDNPRLAEMEITKARQAHAEEIRKQKDVGMAISLFTRGTPGRLFLLLSAALFIVGKKSPQIL